MSEIFTKFFFHSHYLELILGGNVKEVEKLEILMHPKDRSAAYSLEYKNI